MSTPNFHRRNLVYSKSHSSACLQKTSKSARPRYSIRTLEKSVLTIRWLCRHLFGLKQDVDALPRYARFHKDQWASMKLGTAQIERNPDVEKGDHALSRQSYCTCENVKVSDRRAGGFWSMAYKQELGYFTSWLLVFLQAILYLVLNVASATW